MKKQLIYISFIENDILYYFHEGKK